MKRSHEVRDIKLKLFEFWFLRRLRQLRNQAQEGVRVIVWTRDRITCDPELGVEETKLDIGE
jgi:hypothetical protein